MESVDPAIAARKARVWQVLALALSIFMAWWMLPDLDPLQSDAAAHWYRIFSNNEESPHSDDSTWMTIVGRSLSSTMILPPEAVLGFFGFGAMVLLLLGTGYLVHFLSGQHWFALSSIYFMAQLQQPLWNEVDFGGGTAMTVLLGLAVLATAMSGHYRWMGLAFAALLVDSPVYLAFLVVLPWMLASGAAKGTRFPEIVAAFMRWGLVPIAVLALLSFLLGDGYNIITLTAMENGPVEISDFLQDSMMGRLAAQPVYATGLLLTLLILTLRLIQRILKLRAPGFSLLPSMVFVVLLFQEHLFPLTDGESTFVGAMLLWLQVVLALAWLDERLGSKRSYRWVLVFGLMALEYGGWLDCRTPDDLEAKKRIAVEQLDAAKYLETVPSPTDLVMVVEGLPATFRSHNVMVMGADFMVERVLEDIVRFKPAVVALPGYAVYRKSLPGLGYAETLIYREGNVLGQASLRIWERRKEGAPFKFYQAFPLDSISGSAVSRIPGLEVHEVTGEELVFTLPDSLARGVRMGLLQPGQGEFILQVDRKISDESLAAATIPLASDALPGACQVHSMEFEIPFSMSPREIRIKLKYGVKLRVFDPEFVY